MTRMELLTEVRETLTRSTQHLDYIEQRDSTEQDSDLLTLAECLSETARFIEQHI